MQLELPPLPDIFGNYSLKGLEEVVAPAAVSWLPVTLGWQVIAAGLLIGIGFWGYGRWRAYRRNRYRRVALKQLDAIALATGKAESELASLLKATALAVHPRSRIASLSGDAWIEWLEQQQPGFQFNSVSRRILGGEIYSPNLVATEDDLKSLRQDIADWIQRHREPEDA